MMYQRTITISNKQAEEIYHYLTVEPTCRDEHLDYTICNTAIFDNGIEVDIKCCPVPYAENDDDGIESNLAWTEAVMFHNGSECACSDVFDEYVGMWELEYDGDKYIVNVVAE